MRVTARALPALTLLMMARLAGAVEPSTTGERTAGPVESSPCTVSLVSPGEEKVLYGTVELKAEVACPAGAGGTADAARVVFLVDGIAVGEAAQPPYRLAWDAGGSFSTHVVEARLRDEKGRVASALVVTPGSALRESVRVASTPIDRVDLSIAVTGEDGRPVHGLTRDDFSLREDGRERPIEAVDPERRPLSVAILIDVSSSTRSAWDVLRRAAPAFARTLGPEDAAKVIAFSGPARLVADYTRDPRAIEQAMAGFSQWGGGTSLYDTLAAVGVEMAWRRGGRQAVVLLTDGIDTLSRIDLPRLRNYLRRTEVTVETFLLRPEGGAPPPEARRFEHDITLLSQETGGRTRVIKDPGAGMEAAFRELGEELQDRYHLVYSSDPGGGDGRHGGRRGAWRGIEVTARRPGVGVRTRAGVLGGHDIAEDLLADLGQGDAAARAKAAEWLGSVPAAGAAERLLAALADRSPDVRAAAAGSLGKIREPRAVGTLVGLLTDPDAAPRRAASEALQSFGPAAVPALLDDLDRAAPQAQVPILAVLAAIGDARALEAITRRALPPPPLTRETADRPRPDPRVRAWALWALGKIGRPESLPVLRKGAADADPLVKEAAERALAALSAPARDVRQP
ncbi:MAG TPA: VWA domain-containing protein [Candidatus Polarisedimenticolia bacterium]|nr:VWA domain-containing protein [Candidatus Polarisedimenticolia bacterium]